MTSIIAREVGLETEPVALIWSDAKPEDALELKKTAWEVQLTFSVPFELYCEMEKNVSGSFLELDEWRELRDGK